MIKSDLILKADNINDTADAQDAEYFTHQLFNKIKDLNDAIESSDESRIILALSDTVVASVLLAYKYGYGEFVPAVYYSLAKINNEITC